MSHADFYRHALYYDVAFDYRDIGGENDFFEAAFARHGQGPLKRFLELASGPGYHAIEAARRGLDAVALDLAPAMIELCQEKAKARGVIVEGVVADMSDFQVGKPVDLAVNLLTSISYLTSTEALRKHFAAVARALRPGGVYVVENNHPNDFWTREHFQPSRWTMTRDGITVATSWIDEPPAIDLVGQTYEVLARYTVDDRGERVELSDRARLRMLWPVELKAAGEAAGLSLQAFYGALDLGVAISAKEAWRTVAVFRRDDEKPSSG